MRYAIVENEIVTEVYEGPEKSELQQLTDQEKREYDAKARFKAAWNSL